MKYKLNLREVTSALSLSLDYVGIDDNLHGKRVAFMSYLIAQELGYSEEEKNNIIYEGILHDCGVSSTVTHSYLISELDWDNSQEHCIRGEKLLQNTSFYKKYAQTILYHHTHCNEFPIDLDKKIKERANIIYLVDRVDSLNAQNKNISEIIKIISNYSNSFFCENLLQIFVKISQKIDILELINNNIKLNKFFTNWTAKGKTEDLNFKEVKEIAMMFSEVVDAKSNFTKKHSIGVASLAKFLAQKMNLPKDEVEKVEIGGLFHDLGKLRVHDEILNKPSQLNQHERAIMNNHSKDGADILLQIKGFEEIASFAMLHHETLDFKGYPMHKGSVQIPFLARIIIISDIFQALVQDRPYRAGLTAEKSLNILKDMANSGKLDSKILNYLENNLSESYKFALKDVSF
jgi:putative nucleotidyltransferase with HDIG domain